MHLYSRSLRAKQAREIKEDMREGHVDIVVGTHKLTYSVEFKRLGLAIVDEQHKYVSVLSVCWVCVV